MSKQPKALELADYLSCLRSPRCGESAAELRRLHALNAQMLDALRTVMAETCTLKEALEANKKARAAIAAGEQQ